MFYWRSIAPLLMLAPCHRLVAAEPSRTELAVLNWTIEANHFQSESGAVDRSTLPGWLEKGVVPEKLSERGGMPGKGKESQG